MFFYFARFHLDNRKMIRHFLIPNQIKTSIPPKILNFIDFPLWLLHFCVDTYVHFFHRQQGNICSTILRRMELSIFYSIY